MKEMSLSEKLTYSTVLIKCQYIDGSSGSGTGFIINLCRDEESQTCVPVLITNNHVVENSVKTVFEFCKADENGNPIDTEPYCLNYNGNMWIPHPDKEVDLCCLPLGNVLSYLQANNINVFFYPLETNMLPNDNQLSECSAMEDVVMVGYPIGLSDTFNHKPIIRKGITSSHPKKDYKGKKETLIDMACFPGSSGSPVFIFHEGSGVFFNGTAIGSKFYFLGVLYCGPQFDARGVLAFANLPTIPFPVINIPVNLGIIIKSKRILEFENILK